MVLVLAVVVCGTVFGAEETVLRPRRPQFAAEGRGRHGDRGDRGDVRGRMGRRRRMRRREPIERLLHSEEGKALREQLRKDLESLHSERKALHEKIREEIKGGKDPKEVLPGYEDDFKALLKKGILLRLEFREKLIALARKNVDKAVDKIHDRVRDGMRRRRRNRRPPAGPPEENEGE
jgi:hypothetical protein